jgi:hypothetical protein
MPHIMEIFFDFFEGFLVDDAATLSASSSTTGTKALELAPAVGSAP